MNKSTAARIQNSVSTEKFAHLQECIRLFAVERGMTQNEALYHTLAVGLKELQNEDASPASEDVNDLSVRQRAVLQELREGSSVKEIADKLKISEVTVRTHIQRIRTRLGCSDLLKLRMM